MSKACLIVCLIGAATASLTTEYDFGRFSIHTNEELWLGQKYTGYPASYFFDSNLSTPWVFKGQVDSEAYKSEFGPRAEYGDQIYDLSVAFENERWVGEIRIVPGYAKDATTWHRNNRIRRIRVFAGFNREMLLAEVELPDEMRWHSIRFPKVKVGVITLQPIEFYRGPDDDVCVSELEIRTGGVRIGLDSRRASLVNAGGGCCCTQQFWAINRHGTRLKVFDTGEGFPNATISKDGKWIAGTRVSKTNLIELFVIDSSREKIAASKQWRTKNVDEIYLDFERNKLFQGTPRDPFRKLLLDLAKRS